MHHAAKARPAWEDRFTAPTHAQLREAYNKQNSAIFDQAHGALRSIPGVSERILWQDVPWNWTFTFCLDGDTDHPVAYLIPDPAAVKVAVAVPAAIAQTMKTSDLKAEVREAITSAKRVCGGSWPVFEITGRARLDEVMEVIKRRLNAGQPAAPARGAPASTPKAPGKSNGPAKK